MTATLIIPLTLALLQQSGPVSAAAAPQTGPWRAWLDCPGGEIPFLLELGHEEDQWSGWIINEPDRTRIPRVTWDGSELVLDIAHYDSILRVKPNASGDQWDGTWRKRAKVDKWIELPFHAIPGDHPRFRRGTTGGMVPPSRETLAKEKHILGRWSATFGQEPEPSVALFARGHHEVLEDYAAFDLGPSGMVVTGTFMTTTGDYGFLAGIFDDDELKLSNFDGAHAFLITAKLQPDGTLSGDFWSRDAFHDTWTAKKDPNAQLPDAFEMTKGVDNADLAKIAFPGLDGKMRSLADLVLSGKARVIEVFGTWCPNCHDASDYLADLYRRMHGRGLSVVGLAFELTGDLKRDTEQVKTFAAIHKVEYPLLIAGVSDREKASAVLPMLDKLRAYPTLIVLDRDGKVRAVYTGFSGPATGDAYKAFQIKFESLIEELLTQK